MLDRTEPVFFLLGLVLVLIWAVDLVLRRRWSLAEARREKVMRLVHVSEKETAKAEVVFSSGCSAGTTDTRLKEVTGRRRCIVCCSPTTTRCSRCKSVRYCSGKCQIIHWRQGHKEVCYPLHIDPGDGERTGPIELSENIMGNEGKPFARIAGTHLKRSALSESTFYSEIFSEEDHSQDRHFVNRCGTESNSNSSTCSAYSGPIETVDGMTTGEIKTRTSPAQPVSAFFSGGSHVTSGESLSSNVPVFPKTVGELKQVCKSKEIEFPSRVSLSGHKNCENSTPTTEYHDSFVGRHACDRAKVDDISDKTFRKSGYLHVSVGSPSEMSPRLSRQFEPSLSISKNEVTSCTMAQWKKATQLKPVGATDFGTGKLEHGPSGRKNNACLLKLKEPAHLSPPGPVDKRPSNGHGCSVSYGISSKGNISLDMLSRPSQCKSYVMKGAKDLKMSARRVVEQIKVSKTSNQYSSQACMLTSERCSYKMFFPYEIFIKLYDLDVGLRPFGLINCGNSCYANAVLQCLAFTSPLTAYLLKGFHLETCPKRDWCFTCEFESLVLKAKQGGSPLSPIGIITHLKKIGRNLDHGREEDAHEFLRYAIDAMQSACLKEAGTNAVRRIKEETNLIELIFGGYLHSKITCMGCQGKSEQNERMMDLSIEIHDVRTLGEALTRFTTTEILDGKNKYYCSRCKSYERAKKKLTILEAPNVLTITLKRYQSGKFGKINKDVLFPECMNLAPYMSGKEDKSPIYRLYGVVVHLDKMNATFSGHYICYVKTSEGIWYEVDDSAVKRVDLDSVLTKGAYMLLYARSSPRAPNLGRKAQNHTNAKSKIEEYVSSGHERSNSWRMGSSNGHADLLLNTSFLNPSISSSSDSSSILSCSDEGSWSTDSTRSSFNASDYSEYLFGECDRTSRSNNLIY